MSDWLNISTDSGTGNAIITVTASTSEELEARIKHLKVSTITKSRIVEVKQLARDAVTISINPSYIAFNARATMEYTITVTCEGDWEITDYPEWLNITTLSGTGNGTFVVTADPNRGELRQGEIRVATRDTYAICIAAQEAYSPWLILSENEVTLSVSANTFPLEVDSSSRWNATLLEEGYGRNAEEEFLARYTIINLTLDGVHDSPKFFIHDNRSTYRTYYIDGCVSVIVDGVLYSPEDWYITLPTLTPGEHTIWVYSTGNTFNAYALHDFLYYHPDDTCSIKFADNIANVTNYTSTGETYQSPYIYTSITFSDNTRSVNVSGSRAEELNFPSGLTYLAANSMTALTSVTFDEKTNGLNTLYMRNTPISELDIPANITVISDETFENNDNLTGLTLPIVFKSFGTSNLNNNPSIPTLSAITSYSLELHAYRALDFAPVGVLTCREGANVNDLVTYLPSGWTVSPTLPNPYKVRAIYNVEDNTSATTILNSLTGISMMKVNGASYQTGETAYTFSTTGLNEVLYTLSEPSLPSGMFSGVTSLVSIEIGSDFPDLKEIPDNFCNGCTNLASITITPQNGLSIGDYAFNNCSSITTLIWLPEKINSIGNYAFYGCESLTEALLFDIQSIGTRAFASCTGITQATLPNCNLSAGIYKDCDSLRNILVSDGIPIIQSETFENTSITAVTLPESIYKIEQNAFRNCSALTSVVINSPFVEMISNEAFAYCPLLNSITVKSWTCPGLSVNNVFYGVAETGTLYYPKGTMSNYVDADYSNMISKLPSGWTTVQITNMAEEPYLDCTYDCPINGMYDIVKSGLTDCYVSIDGQPYQEITGQVNLTMGIHTARVLLQENNIPNDLFSGCTCLKSIKFPRLNSIGEKAFCNSGLQIIDGFASQNNPLTIQALAFSGCQLEYLYLPDFVTELKASAFTECRSLRIIDINAVNINQYVFNNCINLGYCIFRENVNLIQDYAFNYCNLLLIINSLKETAPRIGGDTFTGLPHNGELHTPIGSNYSGWFGYDGTTFKCGSSSSAPSRYLCWTLFEDIDLSTL